MTAQVSPSREGGPLLGKRVLVVGASSGIGRAVGLRAVRYGAMVAFSARRAREHHALRPAGVIVSGAAGPV